MSYEALWWMTCWLTRKNHSGFCFLRSGMWMLHRHHRLRFYMQFVDYLWNELSVGVWEIQLFFLGGFFYLFKNVYLIQLDFVREVFFFHYLYLAFLLWEILFAESAMRFDFALLAHNFKEVKEVRTLFKFVLRISLGHIPLRFHGLR